MRRTKGLAIGAVFALALISCQAGAHAADQIDVQDMKVVHQDTGKSASFPTVQMGGLDPGFPDVLLAPVGAPAPTGIDQSRLNEIGEKLSRNPPRIGSRFSVCSRGLCASGRRIR